MPADMNILRNSFGYNKTPVKFESMKALQDCPHLGGHYNKEKAEKKAKKAERKEEIRY